MPRKYLKSKRDSLRPVDPMCMRDAAPFCSLAVLVLIMPMASARGQPTDGVSGEQCCSWPPAEELQSQAITAASCQAKDARFEVPPDTACIVTESGAYHVWSGPETVRPAPCRTQSAWP